MLESIQESKAKLRRQVAERVKRITDEGRKLAAAQACALLRAQPEWERARAILFYAPLGAELDVWPLLVAALETGKEAGLPRFNAETKRYEACRIERLAQDLAVGRYGIREPAGHCRALNRLDLILVPGVAFDLHGCRLGRGKGYYDQLLATVRGPTCGVAFEEQVVPKVPVEPHDVTLGCILTPSRWLDFKARPVLE